MVKGNAERIFAKLVIEFIRTVSISSLKASTVLGGGVLLTDKKINRPRGKLLRIHAKLAYRI